MLGLKGVKHGIYLISLQNLISFVYICSLKIGFETFKGKQIPHNFCKLNFLCQHNSVVCATEIQFLAVWGILSSSTRFSFKRHSYLRFHRDRSVTAKSSSCCLLVFAFSTLEHHIIGAINLAIWYYKKLLYLFYLLIIQNT